MTYISSVCVIYTCGPYSGKGRVLANSKFISRGRSGAYVPGSPLAHGLEVVSREDLGCGELALGVQVLQVSSL